MATLSTSIHAAGQAPAIIVPGNSDSLMVSYDRLCADALTFQAKLAWLGITPHAAVSIVLPNSYEFAVAFIAVSWQRAIAAPLNPAYKQEEFEVYIEDLDSAVALVPQNAFDENEPSVRAARKLHAAIIECYWNGQEVVLSVKELGRLAGKGGQPLEKAQSEDTALVLHTSGTTGKPKAVSFNSRREGWCLICHRSLLPTVTWLQQWVSSPLFLALE